jgi:hypothetical protein
VPKVKVVSIMTDNRPGVLAKVCAELARHRNNLHALYAPEGDREATLKILTQDPDAARWQLAKLGYDCFLEEAISVELDNTPGAFSKACRKLSKDGINIRYAFATTIPQNRKAIMVMGVSDVQGALAAIKR